jgi:hypothetical protein
MSSRPSKHSLYVQVIQYAPIKARRVLPSLGRSFGGSHRAVAACEVKKVSVDSSHKSVYGRFGLAYETEEVSAT